MCRRVSNCRLVTMQQSRNRPACRLQSRACAPALDAASPRIVISPVGVPMPGEQIGSLQKCREALADEGVGQVTMERFRCFASRDSSRFSDVVGFTVTAVSTLKNISAIAGDFLLLDASLDALAKN